MDKPLINRIEKSPLISLDLEEFYPKKELALFDLKDYLYQGLILKEKDFRKAMIVHDWEQYRDKILIVFCSSDAIIPVWAYMLISSKAFQYADKIFQGTHEEFLRHHYNEIIKNLNPEPYKEKKIMVKGCSKKPVPASAYLDICQKLMPVAQSIMYGEACSTVPIYKKSKAESLQE